MKAYIIFLVFLFSTLVFYLLFTSSFYQSYIEESRREYVIDFIRGHEESIMNLEKLESEGCSEENWRRLEEIKKDYEEDIEHFKLMFGDTVFEDEK